MKEIDKARRALAVLALGTACLAGCQQLGHSSSRKTPSSLSGEPTKAVTKAQEADMQVALGRAAERRGDLDEAMAAYKDALTRDKNRADAYQRLAILHDRRGDFRQSAELYKLALAADPGNAELFCDMGYSLYLQRRWAESEQNLKQSLRLRPDLARAHNNLGLVLAHDNRPEEALAEYRKAGNDDEKARSNLALALTMDGHFEEARAQYQTVLAANPSATASRDRLNALDRLTARTAARPDPAVKDTQVVTTSAPVAIAQPTAKPVVVPRTAARLGPAVTNPQVVATSAPVAIAQPTAKPVPPLVRTVPAARPVVKPVPPPVRADPAPPAGLESLPRG